MIIQPGQTSNERDERLVSDQHADVFRTEEQAGLKLATQARLVVLAVIAAWLLIQIAAPTVYYFETIVGMFAVIGIANYRLNQARPDWRWLSYLFLALDVTLLTITLITPNPLIENIYPIQLRFRFGNFIYYFLFVALMALSYSPRLMLWAGFASAFTWGASVVLVIFQPGTLIWFGHIQMEQKLSGSEALTVFLDPRFIDIEARITELLVVLLTSVILTAVVCRSRRLVIREAKAAYERANLSRYFPPNIVDRLANVDEPLGAVRSQRVAVMFVDIVGFTRFAEREGPAQTIAMLREFHARLEHAIFDHQGTLDKFLGDGVMATFGTPETGPRDAANALACARAMVDAIDIWNRERERHAMSLIDLSIGLHYGDVVLGNIGSERRLEFAVLGDVVNVTSRLEELTRELGGQVVVSAELVRAIRSQADGEAETLLADFREGGSQILRGRAEQVTVWVLKNECI